MVTKFLGYLRFGFEVLRFAFEATFVSAIWLFVVYFWGLSLMSLTFGDHRGIYLPLALFTFVGSSAFLGGSFYYVFGAEPKKALRQIGLWFEGLRYNFIERPTDRSVRVHTGVIDLASFRPESTES